MSALGTRGGLLALAVAAALLITVGLAAAGAFSGCDQPRVEVGRPSRAVSSSPHGAVARVTARTFARTIHPRVHDTWGEIEAREFITGSLQQYGYIPLTQEFISEEGDERIHSANIIAVKQGTLGEQLVVGAAYDSTPEGEGYADNATGVGLLLEAAARVKPLETPYTIVFVAFGAGQRGEAGARHYVETMTALERRATRGVIALDAVAGGDTLTVTTRAGAPGWLRDNALAAAQSLGLELATSPGAPGRPAGTSALPGSDLPFDEAGLVTAAFTATNWAAGEGDGATATAEGPLWGTAADTVAHVEKRYPGRVGRQLADLSLLLETLLTSELEKSP